MAFDECPPSGVDAKRAEASMERPMRWAARSRAGFDAGGDHAARPALFGIQQVPLDEKLRAQSAAALTDDGFDGYAFGGLARPEGQTAELQALIRKSYAMLFSNKQHNR